MTEMIERVTRAAGITPEQAVLAIKAMRGPTDEMKEVFNDYRKRLYSPVSPYWAEDTWNAMIGAALGE